jgi:hypothetical protein
MNSETLGLSIKIEDNGDVILYGKLEGDYSAVKTTTIDVKYHQSFDDKYYTTTTFIVNFQIK